MADTKHPYGKHPLYLQMPHDLFVALESYRKSLGVPRARIIFEILRGYLGPQVEAVEHPHEE